MKFLIFSTDLPPLAEHPTSGTALRTWNLAEGLKEIGHETVFSVPKDAVSKFSENKKNFSDDGFFKQLSENSFDASNQAGIIARHKPDAIICGHWPAWTLGRKPSVPLIIDLAGPHILERHFQGDNNLAGGIIGKLSAIASADYFIVSGQKQKLYFLSYLLRAQIPHPEERFCEIPMPLPATQDIRDASIGAEPNFIFGGVFLPWQNPAWGLETLATELEKRKKGHLTLVGGPHPHYPLGSGVYKDLFEKLETNPHITRKPLLPFDQFQKEMQRSQIALDLMAWNIERELAITIRSCTYLWSGVPIIYNDFADLSKLIRNYNAGWCIKPGDKQAFLDVLNEIYDKPESVLQKREGALKLSRENFDRKAHALKILALLSKQFKFDSQSLTDINIEAGDNCQNFIKPNITVKQRFVSRLDGLKEIKLLVGTHGKKVTQKYNLTLKDCQNDSIVKTSEVSGDQISDNQWLSLDFTRQPNSAGRNYELSIKSLSNQEGPSISPWTVSYSPYPLNGLYINEEKQGSYSLCMKTISAK